jgi:hypothetical protein
MAGALVGTGGGKAGEELTGAASLETRSPFQKPETKSIQNNTTQSLPQQSGNPRMNQQNNTGNNMAPPGSNLSPPGNNMMPPGGGSRKP